MFRILVWPLVILNIAIICSLSFYIPPLKVIPNIDPETQLIFYLLWLVFSLAVSLVLYAKADVVGEGANLFIDLSFYGTVALVLVTALCIFVANASDVTAFTASYGFILGVTTFGLIMTDLYCFDEPTSP
ncbi:MAG: hypothetical protein KBC62_02515 [Candidatus Pacebacteria bacterium]|nr:hypothetical protein [Candidatus Paceibacterota bacterium]MBP9842856.1 hypothetical protein [Candidatus Paceibacterota bacterium]